MLVKKVQIYFPSKIFEGLIATSSMVKTLNLIKRLNTKNIRIVSKIKNVLTPMLEKKLFFPFKSEL